MSTYRQPILPIVLLVLVCVGAAIAIIYAFVAYNQQIADCDRHGGVLVKGGFSNVCVQPLKEKN